MDVAIDVVGHGAIDDDLIGRDGSLGVAGSRVMRSATESAYMVMVSLGRPLLVRADGTIVSERRRAYS